MNQHTCHALHCETLCSTSLLMCTKCWNKVPSKKQQRVYEVFTANKKSGKYPTKEFQDAVNAAIYYVAFRKYYGLWRQLKGDKKK